MSKQFVDIDDIFSQVEESFRTTRIIQKTSSSKAYKKTGTSKVVRPQEVLPYVDPFIERTVYKSRYTQFVKCLNNLVYKSYSADKLEGFSSAVKRYLSLAENNSKDFKVLDMQIKKDLQDCKNKDSNESYFLGYKDAISLISKLLNQTKIARFQELNNKIN